MDKKIPNEKIELRPHVIQISHCKRQDSPQWVINNKIQIWSNNFIYNSYLICHEEHEEHKEQPKLRLWPNQLQIQQKDREIKGTCKINSKTHKKHINKHESNENQFLIFSGKLKNENDRTAPNWWI